MKRTKKKSTNALDVNGILISAIADFVVGLLLIIVDRLLN